MAWHSLSRPLLVLSLAASAAVVLLHLRTSALDDAPGGGAADAPAGADGEGAAEGQPPPPPRAGPSLPLAEVRAALTKYDTLIASEGDDGIVLCVALTENPNGGSHYDISDNSTTGAWWAKKIHRINKDHCRRYGHPVVVRYAPVKWEPWQEDYCSGKRDNLPGKSPVDKKLCPKIMNREVSAWEKMRMMRDMLNVPGFTHVLVLDGDAVMNHMRRDTMSEMARLLDQESTPDRPRQILLINEDYRGGDGPDGKGTGLNTGMMFAKSTGFTRQVFADMSRANAMGPEWPGPGPWCGTNEQACLESWQGWKKKRKDSAYPGLNKAILKASSLHFGMNPCIWFDCTLEKFPNIPRYEYSESRHHACHHCNGLRVPPGNLTKGRSVGCFPRCDLHVNSSEIGIVHFMGDSRFYIDYLLPLLPQD